MPNVRAAGYEKPHRFDVFEPEATDRKEPMEMLE